ncbi:MAG: hypothetical protein LUG49_03295 [Oscillospiraceae bacterium]|nr:hypothetical protein [Oscillospiraceae bacterium]
MSRKNKIAIAARIVFGILAVASLVVCIYYIVEGNLSEVLSSMTLLLLSISLGYIYGRFEPEPEEGIVPADEKESVKSRIGTNSIIVDDGDWYFEGDSSRSIAVKYGEVVINSGDRKYTITNITQDSFTLKDSSGTVLHAHKR